MTVATKNLGQRIAEVMKAVEFIKKESKVDNKYDVVTHDQVTGILRPHLIANGIRVVARIVSGTSVQIPKSGKTADVSGWIRFEGIYEVDLVNVDDANDRETYSTAAHADDNGDKAPGKALSYAVKSSLLKAFSIETGVNDETRYGSDDEGLSADKMAEIDTALRACASKADLERYLLKALAVAEEAGDRYAVKHFNKIAASAREKLPSVQQPRAKTAESAPAESKAADEPAQEPPADDANEPRASVGLVKMIRGLIDAKGIDEAAVKAATGGVPLEKLSKSRAAAIHGQFKALT